MSSRNYTPLDIRTLGNDMMFDLHVISWAQREAAARAIIRSQQHKYGAENWDSTKGHLHPTFLKLKDTHVAPEEREAIFQMTWEDLCDAVS